ncbi:MAG: oligosaccharide flippase family protein [Planctomycetota bacterium]|jgi:O-antigen/teichoic acid export membrane protein
MKLIAFLQEKLTEQLPANSSRRRFAKGAFWSVAAAVVSQGMRFLAFVIVARSLGKTVFGELGMIQHTVGLFGVSAGLRLGLTATKHVAEFRSADPARAGRIIALSSVTALISGGLLGIAVFFASPYLARQGL